MRQSDYDETIRLIVEGGPDVSSASDNISIISGGLSEKLLSMLPPKLNQRDIDNDLSRLFSVFYHRPTGAVGVASRGASVLSRSPLSGRSFPLFHIGMAAFIPN